MKCEVWRLKLGTRLETRPRYAPTTCFETFPFPRPTPVQEDAVAKAAQALNEARRNRLGDRSDRKRTLTMLCNQKPTWLVDAHRRLKIVVFRAYGREPGMGDERILGELLTLNRSQATIPTPAPTAP